MSGCRDNFLPFCFPFWLEKKMWKNTEGKKITELGKRRKEIIKICREGRISSKKTIVTGTRLFLKRPFFFRGYEKGVKICFYLFLWEMHQDAPVGNVKCQKSSACKSNCDFYSSKNMKHSLKINLQDFSLKLTE